MKTKMTKEMIKVIRKRCRIAYVLLVLATLCCIALYFYYCSLLFYSVWLTGCAGYVIWESKTGFIKQLRNEGFKDGKINTMKNFIRQMLHKLFISDDFSHNQQKSYK